MARHELLNPDEQAYFLLGEASARTFLANWALGEGQIVPNERLFFAERQTRLAYEAITTAQGLLATTDTSKKNKLDEEARDIVPIIKIIGTMPPPKDISSEFLADLPPEF